MPIRADLDPWLIFVALTALLVSAWTAWAVIGLHRLRRSPVEDMIGLVAVGVTSTAIGSLLVGDVGLLLLPLLLFLLCTGLLRWQMNWLSMPGAAWVTVDVFGPIVGWLWAALWLRESDLAGSLKAIAISGLSASLVLWMMSAAERIAREAVLTHGRWKVPVRARANDNRWLQPKVSIHLPCYAEPPEVVKETMNRLASLDYDNFEVIVCDNNTRDEALWHPLESHAQLLNSRLGCERFRFFHVAPLDGAKAGALNFCLEIMARDTEIVGVVDADYYSNPDFLARLVPFFENPRMAYVQTPHDYRDFESSRYLNSCYWEYMPNNKVDMPGVSEYGGAFTIGTMCLLRAEVLKKVGGWAEWCLTEDSEVSVRLRAAGYNGIYLSETFGRGLIPDNFDDYKKQRFRWTAGPVQQLRRHWRLFLPQPFAASMPGWTKILECLRCLAPLFTLGGLVSGLVVLAGGSLAVATGGIEPIDLPNVIWTLLPLATLTWLMRTWHRYRLTGTARIADMIRGEVARASLTYVVLIAGVAGLSSRPLAWRRTPKFGDGGSLRRAISSCLPETILGVLALALAVVIFSLQMGGAEVSILGGMGFLTLAVRFFCAPYMALLAMRDHTKPAVDEDRDAAAQEWNITAKAA